MPDRRRFALLCTGASTTFADEALNGRRRITTLSLTPRMRLALFATVAVVATTATTLAPTAGAQPTPPYSGTIFLDPDIVLASDSSTFESATVAGRGLRTVFDRRANAFVEIDAYLFDLAFSDGTTIEAQINPEFGSEAAALTEAETYGRYVGQLAAALRRDIDALWIHKGTQPFGGGNRSILIHTGQSDLYIQDGILEETLIHEAAHTSLDADHATSAGWINAQNADPTFISTYARDFPQREDIAESFLPYLAVTYRGSRISQEYINTVSNTIPNRLAYFDAQELDLTPFYTASVATEPAPYDAGLHLTAAPNPARAGSSVVFSITLSSAQHIDIHIVDVLGRRVAEVTSRSLPSGDTAVNWSVGGLPPGAYFVRATGSGVALTAPLAVIR